MPCVSLNRREQNLLFSNEGGAPSVKLLLCFTRGLGILKISVGDKEAEQIVAGNRMVKKSSDEMEFSGLPWVHGAKVKVPMLNMTSSMTSPLRQPSKEHREGQREVSGLPLPWKKLSFDIQDVCHTKTMSSTD